MVIVKRLQDILFIGYAYTCDWKRRRKNCFDPELFERVGMAGIRLKGPFRKNGINLNRKTEKVSEHPVSEKVAGDQCDQKNRQMSIKVAQK